MGITVTFTGPLVARTGIREARVGLPEHATLADVIDRLASEYGSHVQDGLLDGGRLRADTIVTGDAQESRPLSTASHVESGQTIRFEHAN